MQDWSLHGTSTGGYFQCNRFQAPASGGDSSDADYFSEDMGSAQAETHRMRHRAQKMARFIHHFTRYQAHGNSMILERRMKPETISRIVRELVHSAEGRLTWLQGDAVPNPLLEDSGYDTGTGKLLVPGNASLDEELGGVNVTVSGGRVDEGTLTPLGKARQRSDSSTTPGSSMKTSGGSAKKSKMLSKSYLTSLLQTFAPSSHSSATQSTVSAVSAAGSAKSSIGGGVGRQGVHKLACIEFLNKGFEELVRCRFVRCDCHCIIYPFVLLWIVLFPPPSPPPSSVFSIFSSYLLSSLQLLRSTFPFAFYAFLEDDDDGALPFSLLMSSMSSSASSDASGLTIQQRRSLKARMLDRRPVFEQLQSDLELLTEMLSGEKCCSYGTFSFLFLASIGCVMEGICCVQMWLQGSV